MTPNDAPTLAARPHHLELAVIYLPISKHELCGNWKPQLLNPRGLIQMVDQFDLPFA
jgi:hypothetical protein